MRLICFFIALSVYVLVAEGAVMAEESVEEEPHTHHAHPTMIELAERQVEWLRSHGGYCSPKISIDPLFESESEDTSIPLGLFARESFEEGETIMVVPRHCLLTAGPSEDMCETTMNLLNEYTRMENGGQSEYEPYVSYVFSKADDGDGAPLPSSWSSRGKNLLRQIRGDHFPPEDLTDVTFENHCGGTGSHELEEFAYRTVVSRGWSDILVPVFDMVNHHSGRYANTDSTLVHGSEDITVFATRDISANEQLFLSYMDCIDEQGFENDYVLPQMLRDMGFVQSVPQRWTFPSGPGSDYNLVLDLDVLDGEETLSNDPLCPSKACVKSPELSVSWRTDEPHAVQLEFLRNELSRLKSLQSYVIDSVDRLDSSNERIVALEYYQSLTTALSYITGSWNTTNHTRLSSFADGTVQDKPGRDETQPENWMACKEYNNVPFQTEHDALSLHQNIMVKSIEENDDACLYLNGYLHMCASTRPHYHEVVVHYAARFISEIKRVAFIGGGDSMVLHEVLKYPSVELVVGLELDDQVTRSSFMNFGTQPHWDDPRVQWYYGDAAKTMSVLPREYFGSFDLVVVDVLTPVAANLRVNDELNLMEAAMLLMKPDGIITKNEDEGYVPGSRSGFTKYSVDVVYHDVPMFCLQVLGIGSNSIDFLTAAPKDHGIETLYLESLDNFQSQFDSWYNFGEEGQDHHSVCEKNDKTLDSGAKSDKKARSMGLLMIVEAEHTTNPPDSIESLQSLLSRVLKEADLTTVDSVSSLLSENGLDGLSLVVHVGEHGHVAARCFPLIRYCAFDVHLQGGSISKMDLMKEGLLRIVESNQSSSYRFVVEGISSTKNIVHDTIGPPSIKEQCCSEDGEIERRDPLRKRMRDKKTVDEFEPPKAATLHSYDNSLALSQWKSQRTIGTQALVQFVVPLSLDVASVTSLLKEAVATILENRPAQMQVLSENVGDGLSVIASWTEGSLVATFNAMSRVDFNLFTLSTDFDIQGALLAIKKQNKWKVAAFNAFPRGTGSVVNFSDEVERIKRPIWA